LNNLAMFWVKNANFFAKFFGKTILKIITSVPVSGDEWDLPEWKSDYPVPSPAGS
jgi:hypothetical protein